jgi:hypothetical protein
LVRTALPLQYRLLTAYLLDPLFKLKAHSEFAKFLVLVELFLEFVVCGHEV